MDKERFNKLSVVMELLKDTNYLDVDISDYIEIKKKVLEVYSEEMRHLPHSRSIENAVRSNAMRGNSVGLDYAEAFFLVRELK